jgi:hypothetical protein
MHVLGPALAGALAIIAPMAAHASGPGSNWRSTNAGPAPNIVLVGDGGGSGGHSGAIGGRPTAGRNGTGGRVLLTEDQTISTAAGASMAGRRYRLTGCGSLGVQSSIIPL